MNVIENDIRDAIEKELVGANERFPLFASMHEAAAVIAEERDEAADALAEVREMFDTLWRAIKRDNMPVALSAIRRMGYNAEHLAIEACQVAAMCEKAVQSAAKWNDERKDTEKC